MDDEDRLSRRKAQLKAVALACFNVSKERKERAGRLAAEALVEYERAEAEEEFGLKVLGLLVEHFSTPIATSPDSVVCNSHAGDPGEEW